MNQKHSNPIRVLAIAPSSRGFGFAVLEGPNSLIDWGVKTAKRDNPARLLVHVEDLLNFYQPGMIVVKDCTAKSARCSKRVVMFLQEVNALAGRRNIAFKVISRKEVRSAFPTDGEVTKHTIAQVIAQKFPVELGFRMPAKRRPWMSENYSMGIFDAVALALIVFDQFDGRSRPVLVTR